MGNTSGGRDCSEHDRKAWLVDAYVETGAGASNDGKGMRVNPRFVESHRSHASSSSDTTSLSSSVTSDKTTRKSRDMASSGNKKFSEWRGNLTSPTGDKEAELTGSAEAPDPADPTFT